MIRLSRSLQYEACRYIRVMGAGSETTPEQAFAISANDEQHMRNLEIPQFVLSAMQLQRAMAVERRQSIGTHFSVVGGMVLFNLAVLPFGTNSAVDVVTVGGAIASMAYGGQWFRQYKHISDMDDYVKRVIAYTDDAVAAEDAKKGKQKKKQGCCGGGGSCGAFGVCSSSARHEYQNNNLLLDVGKK